MIAQLLVSGETPCSGIIVHALRESAVGHDSRDDVGRPPLSKVRVASARELIPNFFGFFTFKMYDSNHSFVWF